MGLTESLVLLRSLLTRASASSKPKYSSPATDVLKGRTATEFPANGVVGGSVADRLFQIKTPVITPSPIAIVRTVAITRYRWVRVAGVTSTERGAVAKTGAGPLRLSARVSASTVSIRG